MRNRLNQGPFPHCPPEEVLPGSDVVMATTPSGGLDGRICARPGCFFSQEGQKLRPRQEEATSTPRQDRPLRRPAHSYHPFTSRMNWTAPAAPFLTLIWPVGESLTSALFARVRPGAKLMLLARGRLAASAGRSVR